MSSLADTSSQNDNYFYRHNVSATSLTPFHQDSASKVADRSQKRALLVGINYLGQFGKLKGCAESVKSMSRLLLWCGHDHQNMIILTDDQCRPTSQPTRKNILTAACWLGSGAQPGDKLLFQYCGHGMTTECGEQAEEVIFPTDFRTKGVINIQDLERVISPPAGVQLVVVVDSLHPTNSIPRFDFAENNL